jgi:hypothetical protein
VAGLVLIDGGYCGNATAMFATRHCRGRLEAFAREHFTAIRVEGTDPGLRRIVERAVRMEPTFATNLFLSAVEFDAERSAETLRQIGMPILVLQASRVTPEGMRVRL